MAATRLSLCCLAVAALAAAGCESIARPIAGHGSTGGDTCTICHGDAARQVDAPVVQAAPATGAHLAHLQGSTFRDPIACAECHPVPTSLAHANEEVDFQFGELASARGVTPSYVDASGTCTTACHGAAPSPAWTSDPTLGCTSCHGYPPASPPHDATTQACATCHPGTVLATGELNRSSKLHLDGKVDAGALHGATWASPAEHGRAAMTELRGGCAGCHGADLAGGTSGVSCTACHAAASHGGWATECTFCHGDPSIGRASPPVDTQGRSDASMVSVGTHASHLGTAIAAPIGCDACHPSRGDVRTDAAHLDGDGVAEVVFGTLARTGGKSPGYTRSTATSASCASTYCHGNFAGGANATISWSSGAQVTCASCHGNPPSSGEHPRHVTGKNISCAYCHAGTLPDLHVNGAKDVRFGGTWNARAVTGTWSSGSCSVSCHGTEPW